MALAVCGSMRRHVPGPASHTAPHTARGLQCLAVSRRIQGGLPETGPRKGGQVDLAEEGAPFLPERALVLAFPRRFAPTSAVKVSQGGRELWEALRGGMPTTARSGLDRHSGLVTAFCALPAPEQALLAQGTGSPC